MKSGFNSGGLLDQKEQQEQKLTFAKLQEEPDMFDEEGRKAQNKTKKLLILHGGLNTYIFISFFC